MRGGIRVLGTLLVGIIALASNGQAAAGEVPGVTKDSITFGTWMPLTGPAADAGFAGRAVEAHFNFINDTQGGVHGRKLKLLIEDTQGNPQKTVAAAKKLVEQDQVFAVISGFGTDANLAVMDYLIERGVPHVAPMTPSARLTRPPQRLIFGWEPDVRGVAGVLTRYGVETLKKPTYAVVSWKGSAPENLAATRDAVQKRGGRVVAEVPYEFVDQAFSDEVRELKASGAEAVIGWALAHQAAGLLKAAKQIGYEPAWLWFGAAGHETIWKLSDNLVEGSYFQQFLPREDDERDPIIREYRAQLPKYGPGQPFTDVGRYGWGKARLVVEALRRAGPDLTRDRLIAALETFRDWRDLATVTYTPTDRRGTRLVWIEQARGGKMVQVSDPITPD
jgi:branched-chain amino acid transport system substrate-binding protein